MKGLLLNTPQDYLALAVRRKWWVVVPFIAMTCAITLLTYILPKTYVSQTLTLIRPRDLPNDFVRDLIAGTPEQRLGAIEQTVLSRTNLVEILQEFDAKMPEFRNLNTDQKVVKLRSQISVTFQDSGRRGPATYFQISYQNQSPELAQKIAAKLTALFIEQDSRAREDQVFGTTEFLSGELEKVSEELKQSETSLKELKERRRYELPDQLEPNLRTLDRLGLQKQANAEALDRYATIRLNLERQITETPAVIAQQGATTIGPLPASISPFVEEFRRKRLEVDQLSAKYTPRHPEVQTAKAQLERLREKIPRQILASLEEEAELPTTPTVPNPLYQNLIAQLQEVQTEFAIREREKEFIESEIEKYSQRVQNAPQSEQDIASILRQNDDLTKQYDDLKKKLGEAKLSESLESKQRGSQFVVVDPANFPLQPAKPVKWAIVLIGAIISLFAGVVFAVAIDFIDQRIWTQSQLETLLGLTVLIEIPAIVTDTDLSLARRKRFTQTASSVALAAAYTGCLYLMYIKQEAVLGRLDPVIQKLMY